MSRLILVPIALLVIATTCNSEAVILRPWAEVSIADYGHLRTGIMAALKGHSVQAVGNIIKAFRKVLFHRIIYMAKFMTTRGWCAIQMSTDKKWGRARLRKGPFCQFWAQHPTGLSAGHSTLQPRKRRLDRPNPMYSGK